jgi:hypothetical protein
MKTRSLMKLSIALLVPIAMGTTYAVATSGDSERAAVAMAETAMAAGSITAAVQSVADAHRIAREKCAHLGAVDRGNCRTEARAEAKRATRIAQGIGSRS